MYTVGDFPISTPEIIDELSRRAYYVMTTVPLTPVLTTVPPVTTIPPFTPKPVLTTIPPVTTYYDRATREQILSMAVDEELRIINRELYPQSVYYVQASYFNNAISGALVIANRYGEYMGYAQEVYTMNDVIREFNRRGYFREDLPNETYPPPTAIPITPEITTIPPTISPLLTREQIINMVLDQELTTRGWSLYSSSPIMIDWDTFYGVVSSATDAANRMGATFNEVFAKEEIAAALNQRGYYYLSVSPPVFTPDLTPGLPKDITPSIPTYIPKYREIPTYLPTPELTPEPTYLPYTPEAVEAKGMDWKLILLAGAFGLIFVGKERIKRRKKKSVTAVTP